MQSTVTYRHECFPPSLGEKADDANEKVPLFLLCLLIALSCLKTAAAVEGNASNRLPPSFAPEQRIIDMSKVRWTPLKGGAYQARRADRRVAWQSDLRSCRISPPVSCALRFSNA